MRHTGSREVCNILQHQTVQLMTATKVLHAHSACAHAGNGIAQAVRAKRAALTKTAVVPDEFVPSPTTASQTLRFHLNKVAWWLDLQSGDNSPRQAWNSPSTYDQPFVDPLSAQVALDHQDLHSIDGKLSHRTSKKGLQIAASAQNPVQTHEAPVESQASGNRAIVKGLAGGSLSQQSPYCPAHMLPSASTELFLQLEAASQHDAQHLGTATVAASANAMPEAAHPTAVCVTPFQACTSLSQSAVLPGTAAGHYDTSPLPHAAAIFHPAEPVQPSRHAVNVRATTGIRQEWTATASQTASPSGDSVIAMLPAAHASCQALNSQDHQLSEIISGTQLVHVQGYRSTSQQLQLQPNQVASSMSTRQEGSTTCVAKQSESSSSKRAKQDSSGVTAAEAPFTKEGSYAVAAQKAKARSLRQQQELQQLRAQQQQAKAEAAGSKHHVAQVNVNIH